MAITDGELQVLAHASEPADVRQGPDVVLAIALELLAKLRAEGIAPEIHGVGVGVPGPVSFRDGVPVAPPIMPGWDQFPVRSVLSQHLGAPVLVDNDVNIMALGEMHAGLSRKVDDFLFVKIGTGVGCGIVVDGSVYRGVSGSAGRHRAHPVEDEGPLCACGNTGCLEAFFSGAALAREALAAARSGRSSILADRLAEAGTLDASDVATAMGAGDPVAIEMVRDGGRRLGFLLGRASSTSSTPAWSSSAARSPPASVTRSSPRSAASSTGARCPWPPATCRSSCPRWAPRPASSARRA